MLKFISVLRFGTNYSPESIRTAGVLRNIHYHKSSQINLYYMDKAAKYFAAIVLSLVLPLHMEAEQAPLQSAIEQTQQNKTIGGTVLDETGQPVIGATVTVPGTNIWTITDEDGKFTLEAPSGSILSISYLGYVEQQIEGNDNSMSCYFTYTNNGYHLGNTMYSEMRLWNKARSQKEIMNNMYSCDPATPGIVFYFKFNEGEGCLFHDATGNGYDVTTVNEVGSTLYPEAEETFEPRVYINQTDFIGNTAELSVVQTPQDVLAPDNISFYLRLTKAATEDVQVTVSLDSPEAEGFTSLTSSSVNLVNPTVTIPAGKLVSSGPVTLEFVMSDEFKGDWTKAITSARISEVSSPDVLIGSDHNTITARLEKKFTNFKGQSSDDLKNLVQIPYDSYFLTKREANPNISGSNLVPSHHISPKGGCS